MSGEESEAASTEDVAADEPDPDAPASSEAANESAVRTEPKRRAELFAETRSDSVIDPS